MTYRLCDGVCGGGLRPPLTPPRPTRGGKTCVRNPKVRPLMPPLLIRLKGLTPPVQGKTWEGAELLRVGRLPGLDVSIQDSSLSRLHAEMARLPSGWVVRDLGSTNGTFLNGEALGRAEMRLRPQDVLQFGEVLLSVSELGEFVPVARAEAEGFACEGVLNTWEDLGPALLSGAADADWELLGQLAQVGRPVRPGDSLDDYLNSILWKAAEILDARQGALVLLDEQPDTFWARVTFDLGTAGGPRGEDRAHLTAALARGRSLLFRGAPAGNGGAATAVCGLLRLGQRKLGALWLARLPDQPPYTQRDLQRTDLLALSASPSIDSVVQLHERQRQVFLKTLNALAQMVQMRDDRTANHAQRVTDYALLLAAELDLPQAERQLLRVGTPLHDLGKIGIREAVLHKPGKLTPAEAAHVREQLLKGAALLEQVPSLVPLLPIVRHVHERFDGSGYPDGLAGLAIPRLARIVAVADAFDAMTTDQPYRPAAPLDQALEEIRQGAGTQFDPECAAALLRLRDPLREAVEQRRSATRTLGIEEIRKVRAGMGLVGAPEVRA